MAITSDSVTDNQSARIVAPRRHRLAYEKRRVFEAWMILIPILLYYALFAIVPVILNIIVSFTDWTGLSTDTHWVGLRNYQQYFKPVYLQILGNTAIFALLILVFQTVLAFFIALLLNQKLFGQALHRAIWYIPTLTSGAVMAQISTLFIDPYNGVLNTILKSLHLHPIIWTVDIFWMRAFIIVFSVWRGIGSPVVLFLAALQGISPELYEAARVDGASGLRLLRYITVPLLRPMILFVVVTSIISGFQIFEAVFLISKGGPFGSTSVLLTQIYNDAFINSNLGLASAGAVIMMLILLWFSTISMRLLHNG